MMMFCNSPFPLKSSPVAARGDSAHCFSWRLRPHWKNTEGTPGLCDARQCRPEHLCVCISAHLGLGLHVKFLAVEGAEDTGDGYDGDDDDDGGDDDGGDHGLDDGNDDDGNDNLHVKMCERNWQNTEQCV